MSEENKEMLTEEVFEPAQEENRILTFRLGKQFYGVSITHVEQILSMQELTQVPEFPVHAKGIMSLRGEVIPVVDLGMCIGLAEAPYTERTCIVITTIDTRHLGCIVDEVDAVVGVSDEQLFSAPRMAESSDKDNCTSGIAKLTGEDGREKVVLCLDLSKLLQEKELAALCAATEK